MKRISIILLAGSLLVFVLAGCGKSEKPEADKSPATTETTTQTAPATTDTAMATDSAVTVDSTGVTGAGATGHSGH
ncbi:MAG: hypothetical protein HRF51_06710 [bacterium]